MHSCDSEFQCKYLHNARIKQLYMLWHFFSPFVLSFRMKTNKEKFEAVIIMEIVQSRAINFGRQGHWPFVTVVNIITISCCIISCHFFSQFFDTLLTWA
jgi:hypothetical protein